MSKLDRQRGCLWGLAIGDALGAAVEFQPPGTFEPVTDFRAGGPHRLQPGEWTDDTSMALALADSIGQVGWDINDQAQRYLNWLKKAEYSSNGRVFDIGITTRRALDRFARKGDAAKSGSTKESSAGNGSIMRLAPVPIAYADYYPDRLEELSDLASQSSLPTHATEACLSACRYFALILAALISGEDRDEVLAPDWWPLQRLRAHRKLHLEIDRVAAGCFRERQPPQIKGSGYVVASLEASHWAFHDAPDFRTTVLKAVNLGDDADTTGAVCGQLAGAFWGESGIPATWREQVARPDLINGLLQSITGDTSAK